MHQRTYQKILLYVTFSPINTYLSKILTLYPCKVVLLQVCLLVHSPSKYVIITRNQTVQLAYQLRQQYAAILTHQEGYWATLNGSCGTYFARLKMPTNRCRMQWNTSVWTTFLLNSGAGLKQEPHGPNVAAQRSMVQERPTKVIPHLL